MIGIFAIAGFLVGIAANLMYFQAGPFLAQFFPQIMQTTWLLWGIIGAAISIVGCLVYATLPER